MHNTPCMVQHSEEGQILGMIYIRAIIWLAIHAMLKHYAIRSQTIKYYI